ncbi:MAG: 30S ribosomal protein S7 [Nitrososphaerota archaeon]
MRIPDEWITEELTIRDQGLKAYISLKPLAIPHSGGRHEHRRFGKAEVHIIERLANMFMRPGRSGGQKYRGIQIVLNALRIVQLRTRENPLQVLIRAIENSAPREDVTRVTYGGITYFKAVDIAPQRRLDLALRWLAEAARVSSFRTPLTTEEALANELILAASNDVRSYAIKKKNEQERVALASR